LEAALQRLGQPGVQGVQRAQLVEHIALGAGEQVHPALVTGAVRGDGDRQPRRVAGVPQPVAQRVGLARKKDPGVRHRSPSR
jgi:hypothetical protein